MVGPNVKAETIHLMDRRSAIEAQMNAIIDRLCVTGGPGLSGNLLDSEGFPRADIDVHAVRTDRNRLAELRNDYKDLTNKIDKNLEILHSAKIGQSAATRPSHSGTTDVSASSQRLAVPMDVDQVGKVPFALVDEIAEASPAAEDGLHLGDQIVKFGSVEIGDQLLARLASEAQMNQGTSLSVLVMRHGTLIDLTVTPRQWRGRGLLGCHFQIL